MSGVLITLGAGAVILCAVLAARGFKGRVATVGIDLGTTFSVVGFKGDKGEVVIVQDNFHRSIFPSVVHYGDDGSVAVGYDALPTLLTDPQHTIYNSKRFIGRKFDDITTESYADSHPFNFARLNRSQSEYSEIGFDVSTVGSGGQTPRVVSPEDVGSQILKYLLSLTADVLGHTQVSKAVIAVPAKFSSKQRAATAEAFRKAGLKVVRVMEEPTAAAVAYDLHKKKDVHQILVYDFGGGTLDVSLLYVADESVQVYATDGDDMLGGSDFDICLNNYLLNRISNGAEVVAGVESPVILDTKSGSCTDLSYIRYSAEQIKKELSFSETSDFSCAQKGKELLQLSVSRYDFEEECQDLFLRSMDPVNRLLTDLGMKEDEVDEVVLVGGTTRIPRVKSQLREYFQQEVNDKIDPDITVAFGAASIVD